MKKVFKVLPAQRPHWVGDGFHVRPLFAQYAFRNEISPFLMFDYAEPKVFPPTSSKLGVGEHPHRGFETVTIALEGEIEHGDSLGNRGVIGTGDIQWMTAARGIIHEEFHSRKFASSGGTLEMMQLWVNLPSKYKMSPPRYQEILKGDIPVVETESGQVRVIAGEYEGIKGAAKTWSPIVLWDVTIKEGKTFHVTLPEDYNCSLFLRKGSITTCGSTITLHQVAILSREGNTFDIQAVGGDVNVFLLGGEPLDEPIAAQGPFVMNTQGELKEAMRDFYSGNFGR